MFQSQEYRSTYAVAVSLAEWQYWNDMKMEDKIAMWILHFTGKQRAKVWKRMQFSTAGINDYLNKNGIEKDEEKDFEHIWREDLTDSKNVYRHKVDLLNCKCFHANRRLALRQESKRNRQSTKKVSGKISAIQDANRRG
eukprot:TRINITY_DN7187_c0_g5_i1.p1 TRINITY_DN7187_c0_g5~~TRINITY_DN7187_c0_g5_i1.p1  ORF type:complete len:139 (+),score=24.63 TRINITY_DN7187_c0_g5_i1:437-853(+)